MFFRVGFFVKKIYLLQQMFSVIRKFTIRINNDVISFYLLFPNDKFILEVETAQNVKYKCNKSKIFRNRSFCKKISGNSSEIFDFCEICKKELYPNCILYPSYSRYQNRFILDKYVIHKDCEKYL
jgi:hypothetical protein